MGTWAKEGLVWGWRFRRLVSAIYCPNWLPTRRACYSDRANSTSEVSRRRSCYRFPDSSGTSIPNWWRQWLLQYLSHTKFYEDYFDFPSWISCRFDNVTSGTRYSVYQNNIVSIIASDSKTR